MSQFTSRDIFLKHVERKGVDDEGRKGVGE